MNLLQLTFLVQAMTTTPELDEANACMVSGVDSHLAATTAVPSQTQIESWVQGIVKSCGTEIDAAADTEPSLIEKFDCNPVSRDLSKRCHITISARDALRTSAHYHVRNLIAERLEKYNNKGLEQ